MASLDSDEELIVATEKTLQSDAQRHFERCNTGSNPNKWRDTSAATKLGWQRDYEDSLGPYYSNKRYDDLPHSR